MNTQITAIYKQYLPDVYRYAFARLGSKEQAEDVAADTFMALLKADLSRIDNIKVWLIGVARHKLIDKYRKQDKSEIVVENIDDVPSLDATDPIEQIEIEAELLTDIKQELTNLSEAMREVVVLRHWQDLKFVEIAEVLQVSENTVKARYYRALSELKSRVESKSGTTMQAVTIPLLLLAIPKVGVEAAFQPTNEFIQVLKSRLEHNPNLNFNSTKMQKILQKFKEVKPIYWVGLLTSVVILSVVLGIELLGRTPLSQPNRGGGFSTSSVAAKTKVQEYVEKYDLAYIEGGEIYLRDYTGAEKLKLTDTAGSVVDLLISPDKKTIVYTTTDKAYVEAQLIKLKNSVKSIGGIEVKTNLIVPTKLFKYNIETGSSTELLNYGGFDLLDDYNKMPSNQRNIVEVFYHLYINDYGITLKAFNSSNSNQIVFAGKGFWVMDLDSGAKAKVSDSFNPEDNYVVIGDVVFNGNRIIADYFLNDSLRVDYYTYQSNAWAKTQIKNSSCTSLGSDPSGECKVLFINSKGEYVINNAYQTVSPLNQPYVNPNKIDYVNPETGEVIRSVDFTSLKDMYRYTIGVDAEESIYYYNFQQWLPVDYSAVEMYKVSKDGQITSLGKLTLPENQGLKVDGIRRVSADGKYMILTSEPTISYTESTITYDVYLYEIGSSKVDKIMTWKSSTGVNVELLTKFGYL